MKLASSAATVSGQQHVKRSVADMEAEAPIEVPMEKGTDKRVALPRASAAITTQEGFDGYRKMATRIASVEMGKIMELLVTGLVLKWAR